MPWLLILSVGLAAVALMLLVFLLGEAWSRWRRRLEILDGNMLIWFVVDVSLLLIARGLFMRGLA